MPTLADYIPVSLFGLIIIILIVTILIIIIYLVLRQFGIIVLNRKDSLPPSGRVL